MIPFRFPCQPLVAAALALAACGGAVPGAGADPPAWPLRLSTAVPSEHEGALQLDGAATISNEHRVPDAFSAEPYCLLRFMGAQHTSGARYDLAVAFATADRRVLALTVTRQRGSEPWWVAAFDPPAAEATVNLAGRVVELKGLRSTQGAMVDWRATLDGTLHFPAHATQAACG